MRRLLVLGAVLAAAAVLVAVVEAPRVRRGQDAVTGPRLFKMSGPDVTLVEIAIGPRRVRAERAGDGWSVGGAPASPQARDAVTDLVDTLVALRALDRFRPADGASFGLEPPRATITLASARRRTEVRLGELNAARSAVYARRDDGPHVMLVGLYVVAALERVVYFASRDLEGDAAPRDDQRPEMG